MNSIQICSAEPISNVDYIKDGLRRSVDRGDEGLKVYSALFMYKECFDLVKLHFRERLGDICSIKSARAIRCSGYKIYGIEVIYKTSDKELLHERIHEMFNGKYQCYINIKKK
jgi:hypothetical protein